MNSPIMLIMLSVTLIIAGFLIPSMSPDYEKLSPYECGFDPNGSARLPFSMRFFLVAILFILFDLEIALLLPLPWGMQLTNPLVTYSWALIVVIILGLGLAYEWKEGGLEWAE